MRFIKFNFLDGTSFGFCLDDVMTFEADSEDTKIELRSGREIIFPMDIDDFCTRVFSDEHGDNEYQLVEIDEPEPPGPRVVGSVTLDF